MVKSWVTIKVGFLMAIAVSFLLATGYLAYRNLSSVVASIPMDVQSEMMLMDIRKLSMDLEQAESSIRLYMITRDTGDLRPYYNFLSTIDRRLDSLRIELAGDPSMQSQTDTLRKLIQENITNWKQLLYLNRNNRVSENLRQLSDSLHVDTLNESNQETGLLARVFRKYKETPQPDRLALIEVLEEIQEQERIDQRRLMAREYERAVTSARIRERIYGMITRLEAGISGMISEKASDARILAGKTYQWLTLFSIAGTLLAILVLFTVVRFVRKTMAYQSALENSKEQAENLARTKELFMANMSHEIRTPVTAISGFAEQLQRGTYDQKTSRIIQIIKSSSDHLSKIIEDILDFSRLQQTRITLDKVHFTIRRLAEEVYVMFEHAAERNSTALTYSLNQNTPEVLLGDPHRLKQILINLVSNAVKFSPGGTVHFGIRCLQGPGGDVELILEVTDSGIGIDESKLNIIFEDFTQEENSITRQYGGTGLGLSIVKKLVELHGGSIEVKSKKGRGTRFSVRLPYLAGDPRKIDAEYPYVLPENGTGKMKVLVVDDEEYNRLLFRTILERMQVEYHEAEDGTRALRILRQEQFDMMFIDIRMPGIDGLELTRIIREQMKISKSDMPIICISAASVKEQWPDYDRAGMNAFLPKPFAEKALHDIITATMANGSSSGVLDHRSVLEVNDPQTIDNLNLQTLYHIAGGDLKFVRHMLDTYKETTGEGLRSIDGSISSGDFQQAAEQAHKILPPSRHLGATRLCRLLEQIEANIQAGTDAAALKGLTREALKEFGAITTVIEEHISELG